MSDAKPGTLNVDTQEFVTTLEIHNPARRNAMTFSMWSELGETLSRLAKDDATRVLIVKGAGDKAFCAGNDISEFEHWRTDPERAATYSATTQSATMALREFPKPVISAITGFCIGGGLELALLGDIRVCSADSMFAVTPARLGLGYSLTDTQLLVQRIGGAATREMLFTASLYNATHALRLGLVSQIHESTDFPDAVSSLAAQIARNAPLSVRASKAIVAEAEKPEALRDVERCDALVRECAASNDFTEGRNAFAAKRKPEFTGT